MKTRFITAVALYGAKEDALKTMLHTIQEIIREQLGTLFEPYTLAQIHSTLINLNWLPDEVSGLPVNERYDEVTGFPRPMLLDRALEILYSYLEPPLNIRIGGYRPDSRATFSSRGMHPHDRMFSVQGPAFVVVGWPLVTISHGISEKPLDDLRRNLGEANVLHLYHKSPSDIDNDFHIVVGHHVGATPDKTQRAVEAVRQYMAEHLLDVSVGSRQLAIVASDSPTLAPVHFMGRLPEDYPQIAELFR